MIKDGKSSTIMNIYLKIIIFNNQDESLSNINKWILLITK